MQGKMSLIYSLLSKNTYFTTVKNTADFSLAFCANHVYSCCRPFNLSPKQDNLNEK